MQLTTCICNWYPRLLNVSTETCLVCTRLGCLNPHQSAAADKTLACINLPRLNRPETTSVLASQLQSASNIKRSNTESSRRGSRHSKIALLNLLKVNSQAASPTPNTYNPQQAWQCKSWVHNYVYIMYTYKAAKTHWTRTFLCTQYYVHEHAQKRFVIEGAMWCTD